MYTRIIVSAASYYLPTALLIHHLCVRNAQTWNVLTSLVRCNLWIAARQSDAGKVHLQHFTSVVITASVTPACNLMHILGSYMLVVKSEKLVTCRCFVKDWKRKKIS